MKRNKKRAKFGVKWWDRFGHATMINYTTNVLETWGGDEHGGTFVWPKLCPICKVLHES